MLPLILYRGGTHRVGEVRRLLELRAGECSPVLPLTQKMMRSLFAWRLEHILKHISSTSLLLIRYVYIVMMKTQALRYLRLAVYAKNVLFTGAVIPSQQLQTQTTSSFSSLSESFSLFIGRRSTVASYNNTFQFVWPSGHTGRRQAAPLNLWRYAA